MPRLDISLSGEANASASGNVTDPAILQKIEAVMRHLQDRAQTDAPPATPTS